MLSGVTASALAITGTAVFRIVVSSDSMKKATATSQGSMRLRASRREGGGWARQMTRGRGISQADG